MREDMVMSKRKTERTDAQGIMGEQLTGGRTADIFIRQLDRGSRTTYKTQETGCHQNKMGHTDLDKDT